MIVSLTSVPTSATNITTTSTSSVPTNNADFVDYLLNSTKYDKRERPDQNANKSVEVTDKTS